MPTRFQDLPEELPKHFPDCCPAVSRSLIRSILALLPRPRALILSIGCGSGFLESLLLVHAAASTATSGHDHGRGDDDDGVDRTLALFGVEVSSCPSRHLPDHRVLRVAGTHALHADAILASALLFVYPRQPILVQSYLEHCRTGALEKVLWLGPRCDWPDYRSILESAFANVRLVHGCGAAESDLLVVAANS